MASEGAGFLLDLQENRFDLKTPSLWVLPN